MATSFAYFYSPIRVSGVSWIVTVASLTPLFALIQIKTGFVFTVAGVAVQQVPGTV
jgi:hypothetical protein